MKETREKKKYKNTKKQIGETMNNLNKWEFFIKVSFNDIY